VAGHKIPRRCDAIRRPMRNSVIWDLSDLPDAHLHLPASSCTPAKHDLRIDIIAPR